MIVEARGLYDSPNGDRWYVVREPRSGRAFIRHEPNSASGGNTALIEIADFLRQGAGPEQQELLRLIGTLVEVRFHGSGDSVLREKATSITDRL